MARNARGLPELQRSPAHPPPGELKAANYGQLRREAEEAPGQEGVSALLFLPILFSLQTSGCFASASPDLLKPCQLPADLAELEVRVLEGLSFPPAFPYLLPLPGAHPGSYVPTCPGHEVGKRRGRWKGGWRGGRGTDPGDAGTLAKDDGPNWRVKVWMRQMGAFQMLPSAGWR